MLIVGYSPKQKAFHNHFHVFMLKPAEQLKDSLFQSLLLVLDYLMVSQTLISTWTA